MSKKQKLSLVIPCFNEAKNVSIVLKKLQDILDQSPQVIEIIVVDGGSTDDTPQELKQAFKNLDADVFKLILMSQRGGYGNDIMHALRSQATGDVLAWTHADLQTDPKDVVAAFEMYVKEATNSPVFIKGQRKNRRFVEAFFTFGMQLIAWSVLKTYLQDINAQPKLFSREFYDQHLKHGYPADFSLDLYALYLAKTHQYKILTLPVYFAKRQHGEAKGGGSWKSRLRLIHRTLKYIFKLKKNLSNT